METVAFTVEASECEFARCIFAENEQTARLIFIEEVLEDDLDMLVADAGEIAVTRRPSWDHFGAEENVPVLEWSKAGYDVWCEDCAKDAAFGYNGIDMLPPNDVFEVEGRAVCAECASEYARAKCKPCDCGAKPWAHAYGPVTIECDECGTAITRDTVAEAIEAWNRGEADG